ncbi:MAG: ornithine cyclodeaminase family protein [Gammaproteobacteria bacterium]|jgi:ornithine cyclodeaminase|nr:ornithine cyclodeaminase family protein [Gammaproteobacteria bacterium]
MYIVDAQRTEQLLPYGALVAALSEAFAMPADKVCAPSRMHYAVADPNGSQRTLLIMPAWAEDAGVVVKLVNVVPNNGQLGLPAIQAQVLVADSATGAWSVMIDGATLTARRTAAASAVAAQWLAPATPDTMLVVGTGRLSKEMVAAHRQVRPSIKRVLVWGRDSHKAAHIAQQITGGEAAEDLARACGQAQIISCCTLSAQPLVRGEWIQAGTHVDLVGAYRPDLRESDGALVAKARVFVDTLAGANGEAGDLLQAQTEGVFAMQDIEADLQQLAQGNIVRQESDITLFKSVGAALEDFVAARLVAGQVTAG